MSEPETMLTPGLDSGNNVDMQNTTNTRRYTVLGTTDEWDACDCCGRSNLKVYVVLRDEDGETYRYGTGCAAKAEGIPATIIRTEARTADEKARAEAAAARQAASNIERDRWFAFLAARSTKTEVPDQIADLGGFAAAKALYRGEAA